MTTITPPVSEKRWTGNDSKRLKDFENSRKGSFINMKVKPKKKEGTLLEKILISLYLNGEINEKLFEQKLFRKVTPQKPRILKPEELMKRRLSALKKQRISLKKFEAQRGLSKPRSQKVMTKEDLEIKCLLELFVEEQVSEEFLTEYMPRLALGLGSAAKSAEKSLVKKAGNIAKAPARLAAGGIKGVTSAAVGKVPFGSSAAKAIAKTKPASKARMALLKKIQAMSPSFSKDLLGELI